MSTEQEEAREQAIARARSIKAFRIARILNLTDAPIVNLATADHEFRQFVAAKADVNEPSDVTWQMALDMLDAMRRD